MRFSARGFATASGLGAYFVDIDDGAYSGSLSVTVRFMRSSPTEPADATELAFTFAEELDQFIASLQGARAVLADEAGGQPTQEQAEAAAGMEPLDEGEPIQEVLNDTGASRRFNEAIEGGVLAGLRVHPWPDFSYDKALEDRKQQASRQAADWLRRFAEAKAEMESRAAAGPGLVWGPPGDPWPARTDPDRYGEVVISHHEGKESS